MNKKIELLPSIEDMQSIIDVIPNPVFIKNRDHHIVMFNESACVLFGHDREWLSTHSEEELFPPEQIAVFRQMDNRVFETGEDNENEEQVTDISGAVRTMVTRKRLIHLKDGTPLLVAVATDVTAFREAEAHSRYLSLHDPLTGLPNRALLNERIDHCLARTRRRADQCALIYVDLDRFKQVNDSHGHQAGDDLIREFANRLSTLVRASDTVARLGGDEFAVLLTDMSGMGEVEQVCERILDAAREPFAIAAAQAFVGASIGVVFAPTAEIGRVEMQRRADVALYQSKNGGRDCFRIYSEVMDESIRRQRLIERELRAALDREPGLEVHYQPLVASAGERVVAMEALVRWRHRTLGMMVPAQFISVAEDSGLIGRLGEWVLERACRTLRDRGDVAVAVNLSPIQLRDPGLAGRLISIVRQTGLPLERLQLEVTESAILNADDTARATLKRLRSAGVKIALDDFGTGYSSLSHLRDFEVDKVKIDRSFVQHIGELQDSAVIVQAVASLGRTLGLSVVAEGVETDEQRQFLCATGCDELQGYLLSRPMPEPEALAYLDGAAGVALVA